MELGRHVLDQQVIDRNGELMGKVDGITLELRAGQPPRVSHVVIGGGTAARRVSQRFARWLLDWRRRFGPPNDQPLSVPWSKVLKIGVDVKLDLEAERTSALSWEHWVQRRIIGRIPGA
jgi:sporulation protein YlmC with PRC-barrel domain